MHPETPSEDPAMLRQFLERHDVPCPCCGYNLRGLTGDACPECNQRLVLRVGLALPRQRAFIAGLVGLAAGTGFSGLLLVYVGIMIITRRGSPSPGEFLTLTGVPFVIEGAALLAWLKYRAWLQTRSPRTRVHLVAGGWVLTAINVTLFSMFVR